MQLVKYLVLPKEITPFEQNYLKRLNKIGLVFFYLHIPALMALAWAAGTGPLSAAVLTLIVMIGPTIAYQIIRNPRMLSVIYGITAMLMGGLLVHFGQGPVQIEMHFYFFALLAMLCMFANPLVNIAAAATVALHHLVVWLIIPSSVFNYEAQWWVVLVHAAFVVLETVAACYISRQFFDNVIGLEKIVQARTATINEKQRDMRLILDNVREGLITIDLEGRMASECSLMIEQQFGLPTPGTKLATWLAEKDAAFGDWLDLGLEIVKEGILPSDVALGQLPKRLQNNGKTYSVQYQLITSATAAPAGSIVEHHEALSSAANGEARAEKILVIFADITEQLRTEAAERHQAELLKLFQHIMDDKAGFIEFLAEYDALMKMLKNAHGAEELLRGTPTGQQENSATGNVEHMKQLIHTLKGNAAVFGMRHLSNICHDLENLIAEENRAPTEAEMASLHQAWRLIRIDVENLMGQREDNSIVIDDKEYQIILKAVLDGVDKKFIARMIESWKLESAGTRLHRIEQQIKGLLERLGKNNVTVVIEPNDLRFNSERFVSFWSTFIHVLRNAVDHGIEDVEQRKKLGKPEQSQITISTSEHDDKFIVTVEDDGPGVDWNTLQMKAKVLGVPAEILSNPEELICLPGLSSKANISELSGRGVGMTAVRDACVALGGTMKIESMQGVGMRVSFIFPKCDSVYEGHAAMLKRAM